MLGGDARKLFHDPTAHHLDSRSILSRWAPDGDFARQSYRGLIEIKVGDVTNQKSFHVHEALLASHSPFFKAALTRDWQEAKDRVVNFPEDDVETFRLCIHFLYTGKLAVQPDPKPTDYKECKERKAVIAIYVLEEKLQDVETKNATLQALLQACHDRQQDNQRYWPGPACVRKLHDGTAKGSLARKLMVDIYASLATSKWITKAGKADN
ncbi:hypothetical protein K458DRAFT_490786 [Lentithecium fluviatile CBS 122367]|uniref:BTB domain-containing protein n=1 Tax=Lentithecium fluviatile CBS 122367 TaxID=1168545 RepID=A0A6G1ILS8_9PLEO|nr:hypothetical protein K458DRAFT_490786 [Lentithecium fluviatile CBS 122367]